MVHSHLCWRQWAYRRLFFLFFSIQVSQIGLSCWSKHNTYGIDIGMNTWQKLIILWNSSIINGKSLVCYLIDFKNRAIPRIYFILYTRDNSQVRRSKDLSKWTVKLVTPHEFCKFIGIVLKYPEFINGANFLYQKDNHGVFTLLNMEKYITYLRFNKNKNNIHKFYKYGNIKDIGDWWQFYKEVGSLKNNHRRKFIGQYGISLMKKNWLEESNNK